MLSKLCRKLVPYNSGEQPRDRRYVKLNTNENPYAPSPAAVRALRDSDSFAFARYPDPDCVRLREAIAEHEGVKPENVFVGNGSDEVLAFAFAALFDEDKPVKFADVTYSFYPVYCDLWGLAYRTVALRSDFTLDRQGYRDLGGAVIANPNAPTGIYEDVSEFIGKDFPVIIDEAYIDFSGAESMAKRAAQSKNAVAVKTFSKSYSLAGLRCGYAVANPEITEGIVRVKNSFNSYSVNALTQAAALAAVCDEEHHRETVEKVIATREEFCRELTRKGYEFIKSAANFVLVTVPDGNGEAAYLRLKERGVLVRYFNAPRLKDKLRISIGTPQDMAELMKAMTG